MNFRTGTIYKLVADDPDRRKLSGHEKILGGFEAFRLEAIVLALRAQDGLPIDFLYQVNKLHWQSERVITLATLKEIGRLDKVSVDVLKGLVDDPWAGTAAYPTGQFYQYGPFRQISISDWMMYAEALEHRSKADAAEAYRQAFLGQTSIRTSLEGDPAMYPFRVHALRRLLFLKPDVLPELIQYSTTDKCPGALRAALLCVYAAEHDRIGPQFVDRIPNTVPLDRFNPSMYVDGMLKAFEMIRTGKESPAIKSGTPEMVHGYVAVLISYDQPELTKAALAALKYRSLRLETPRVNVGFGTSYSWEITPFHFMDRNSLIAAFKRMQPGADPVSVADGIANWAAKIWPEQHERALPKNVEQIRKLFVTQHRLLEFPSKQNSTVDFLKRFEADATVEDAGEIVSHWQLYEPHIVRKAAQVLMSDSDAINKVARLVSSMTKGTPSSGFGCALLQQQAELIEVLFADLQAFEVKVTDLAQRQRVQSHVVQPIMRFLDEGHNALAKAAQRQ